MSASIWTRDEQAAFSRSQAGAANGAGAGAGAGSDAAQPMMMMMPPRIRPDPCLMDAKAFISHRPAAKAHAATQQANATQLPVGARAQQNGAGTKRAPERPPADEPLARWGAKRCVSAAICDTMRRIALLSYTLTRRRPARSIRTAVARMRDSAPAGAPAFAAQHAAHKQDGAANGVAAAPAVPHFLSRLQAESAPTSDNEHDVARAQTASDAPRVKPASCGGAHLADEDALIDFPWDSLGPAGGMADPWHGVFDGGAGGAMAAARQQA